MKKKIRIFSLMLMAILAVSSVVGCSKKDDDNAGAGNSSTNNSSTSGDNGNGDGPDKNVVTPDGTYVDHVEPEPDVVGTIHERSIGSTEYKLFNGGATEYKIVLANNPTMYDGKAAAEINMVASEATGVQFLSLKDDSVAYSDTAKYISIGDTGYLESAGITIDYDAVGPQGYEIITKGQSIFIAGGDKGVFYGALDLLDILFNYEYFTAAYYTVDKNVKDVVLPDLDIKEKPDFLNRISPYGETFMNSYGRDRMRMIHDSEIFVQGAKTHSAFDILPPATWKEAYPEWYSNDGQQLCLTAHSKVEEYEAMLDNDGAIPEKLEAMIQAAVEKCKDLLTADPDHDILSISQMDVNVWCGCDSCTYLIERYGTPAATQMIFINNVAERMEPWIEENFPGREVFFDMLAYHKSEKAPAKEVDGKWVAIDEHVKLRPNVQVFMALIGADYISGINAPTNIAMKNTFLSWAACSGNFAVWTYDCYFGNYLVPYDSWGAMSDMMKFLYKINAHTLFIQGNYNLRTSTNFDSLKNYVYAKLQWNVNLDMQELIHNYFESMYRDMSDTMETVYWNMRTELFSHSFKGRGGSIWENALQEKYYSKQYFVDQLALLESAIDEAEKYKTTDPTYYAWVVDDILGETIGPRYGLLELYKGTFSEYERAAFIEAFSNDVTRLTVDRVSEGGSMADYLANL
ncbi:MAG: DUF4838 domain-containing protein [Clostridia bacterium]|nr:DUF4838 domain-containing protein [Clostridia bacterium]